MIKKNKKQEKTFFKKIQFSIPYDFHSKFLFYSIFALLKSFSPNPQNNNIPMCFVGGTIWCNTQTSTKRPQDERFILIDNYVLLHEWKKKKKIALGNEKGEYFHPCWELTARSFLILNTLAKKQVEIAVAKGTLRWIVNLSLFSPGLNCCHPSPPRPRHSIQKKKKQRSQSFAWTHRINLPLAAQIVLLRLANRANHCCAQGTLQSAIVADLNTDGERIKPSTKAVASSKAVAAERIFKLRRGACAPAGETDGRTCSGRTGAGGSRTGRSCAGDNRGGRTRAGRTAALTFSAFFNAAWGSGSC